MNLKRTLPLAAAAFLTPVAAEAHPGHMLVAASPFLSGLLHPLTGADHLAAMGMVGLWAGVLSQGGEASRGLTQRGGSRRALWAVPAAFVSAMVAGFGFGLSVPGVSGAETMIVASVLALGVAVALRVRAPLALACVTVAAFGFAHGMAHGSEAPSAGIAQFAGGFVIATAALHALGVGIARRVPSGWVRTLGAIGAVTGVLLAAG